MTERRPPRHGLDDALLTSLRFSLVAVPGTDVEINFTTLRELLETEDSAFTAIATRSAAGQVLVRKGYLIVRAPGSKPLPAAGRTCACTWPPCR
ncbi:ArsR family transcriptional regulator [Cryobacterium sp. Y62]|uniref:ArsR family transcriptional regulator n=1 Tax=Cryobacterium sp. Y62 TaxID=2048284 RepID=UPI000CE4D595|nr:ArsR family transcriptional regulator [Cryobacterium sp. Y62]